MNYYIIEFSYIYEKGLSEKEIENKKIQIENEINKMAEESNGTLKFYSEKIKLTSSCICIEKIKTYGLGYNWEFKDIEDAKNFILKLPHEYNILWIHKNPKTFKKDGCVIYNINNISEIIKINDNEEKKLYNIVIDRINNKI